MATGQMNGVVQQLHRLALDGAGATDGELLRAFIQRRDEAALAALVLRHGPMVWGVCRRLLRTHHDAEDAFQATFLVLVRKAASVRNKEAVGNWLYGVAHQTATRARTTMAKRRGRERQVTDMPEPTAAGPDPGNELLPLLDQELSGLPDKYRTLIVLCDLEGKTRKEAARQLGCPEGTVGGRLARARALLARRMARHGLAVSGGALATTLSRDVAAAGVPAAVASSAVHAAQLLAAGKSTAGLIPVEVVDLTEGVLKTMLLTKLKTVSAVLLMAGVIGVTTTGLSYTGRASDLPDGNRPAEKGKATDSETDNREMKRFTGAWKVRSVVIDGRKLPPAEASGNDQVGYDGVGSWRQLSEGQTVYSGTVTVDPTAKPKAIDYKVVKGGRETGKTIRAIYEFVDEDTYRVCYPAPDGERPADFSCKQGSGHTVCVLKREKAPPPDPEDPRRPPENRRPGVPPLNPNQVPAVDDLGKPNTTTRPPAADVLDPQTLLDLVSEPKPTALTLDEAVKDKVNQTATIEVRVKSAAMAWTTGFGAPEPWVIRLTPTAGLKDGREFQLCLTSKAVTHLRNLGLVNEHEKPPADFFRDKVIRLTGKIESWENREKKGTTIYRLCVHDLDHLVVVK